MTTISRRICAIALVLAVLSTQAARAQSEPLVTQAVQVTPNPEPVRAHSSPQIARNPVNGELAIVASNPRAEDRNL